jgi:hypothetical protein
MTKVFFAFAVVFAFAGTAQAVTCKDLVGMDQERVGPVVPVKSVTVLTGDLLVVTTPAEPKIGSDGVFPVYKLFTPELYEELRKKKSTVNTFIYVRQSVSLAGDKSMWLYIAVPRVSGECHIFGFGDRVYWQRVNFPYQSWDAVRDWEIKNPKNVLVHQR